MIFLALGEGGESKMVILEHKDLNTLRGGGTVETPEGSVIMVATNDAAWLSEKLASAVRSNGLNGSLVAKLIMESNKRPVVTDRPNHGMVPIVLDGHIVPQEWN
jgi:hypothetical protein